MFQAKEAAFGKAEEPKAHLLPCPQLPLRLLHSRSFHLPMPATSSHPQLPTSPLMGTIAWCECGLFPLGGNWRDAAGEAAGTVSWNTLALALSWRPWKAFVLMAQNGFQERASIFAANRDTKDVEGYCGLSKEELILRQAAWPRRGSSAGRAPGGCCHL